MYVFFNHRLESRHLSSVEKVNFVKVCRGLDQDFQLNFTVDFIWMPISGT